MIRRVWLAGLAAILPVAVSAAEPLPSAGAFTPPAGQLVLTRTLRHVLHDGRQVAARRSYRVYFTRERDGFRLDGELADVTVDAPAGLQALAEIERRRPDTDLFPIRLDVNGMIVPAPEPAPSEAQREAVSLATAEIARMQLGVAERAQAQGFVARFQARAHRSPWPLDLFHPVPGARREERTVPLPDEGQGRVVTEIEASTDPAGTLAAFKRKVTTNLGGDRRVVDEEWTLAPVP